MSDLFPDNPAPEQSAPEARLGPDGKPRRVFDTSMMRRFPGKERNLAGELAAHFRRADASDARRKSKGTATFEGSRQMAERLDAERNGEETETKENE